MADADHAHHRAADRLLETVTALLSDEAMGSSERAVVAQVVATEAAVHALLAIDRTLHDLFPRPLRGGAGVSPWNERIG